MYYSCKYCGRMHQSGVPCPMRPQRKSKRDRRADKFRNTAIWQRKREEIRLRDRYVCRVCLDKNKINSNSLEVHHIAPLEEAFNKRLEDSNLITLCVTHHKMADRKELSPEYLIGLTTIPPAITGVKK